MRLKDGVNPIGLKTEMLLALFIIDGVYESYTYECVITSLNDGIHHPTSRHYQGMAGDSRTRHLATGYAAKIANEIRRRLGPHYYVRLESDHIHVSYKPFKP